MACILVSSCSLSSFSAFSRRYGDNGRRLDGVELELALSDMLKKKEKEKEKVEEEEKS